MERAADVEGYMDDYPNALLCEEDNELLEIGKKTIAALKYNVFVPANVEKVMEHFKYDNISLVVLSESFAGGTSENNEVLEHLKYNMPINERRNIFIALTGKEFYTGDDMQAFVNSVNIVVNEKDAKTLHKVLKKSIQGNDFFYKIYKNTMQDLGKI